MSLARATGFARERGTLEKPKLRASVCACLWAWVWVGAGVALGDTLSLSIFLSRSLSLSLGVYVVVWAWVQLWRQRQHGTVVASVACESVSACMVMKYQYNDRGVGHGVRWFSNTVNVYDLNKCVALLPTVWKVFCTAGGVHGSKK